MRELIFGLNRYKLRQVLNPNAVTEVLTHAARRRHRFALPLDRTPVRRANHPTAQVSAKKKPAKKTKKKARAPPRPPLSPAPRERQNACRVVAKSGAPIG